ncbi:MAG: NAD(P)-dependent oxidoreductase [Caldilineaceae bacterium]|nr:NAD(P)-dependent oxidoreductase [Caldilineaceae bacterium]
MQEYTIHTIGILHPGQMGISVAASARAGGNTVLWASEGRSSQTAGRAAQHGLEDAGTLAELCRRAEIILSVCPPHAAEAVAQAVADQGFEGIYVDANAIAPQRAQAVAATVTQRGATCVDGGIIGGPAWKPGTTWLYLSGPQAETVAACFAAGPLGTEVIGDAVGKASALKMCYAAYTKGTTALLAAILGAAEQLDVRAELEAEWARNGSTFALDSERRVREVTAKAWRFVGEMHEIAATFEAAQMPGGFHQAAAEIYTRLAQFKDASEMPGLEAVLDALGATQPDSATQ